MSVVIVVIMVGVVGVVVVSGIPKTGRAGRHAGYETSSLRRMNETCAWTV